MSDTEHTDEVNREVALLKYSVSVGVTIGLGTTAIGLVWSPNMPLADAALAGAGAGVWAAIVFPVVVYVVAALGNRMGMPPGETA